MTDPKNARSKAGDAGPSAGEQLKTARKERNLTVQQVGQALHLDTWILEALEEGRFRDVGAPVFVKGHLRKYAAEVGVDQDALMEAYYRAEDTPETPELVTDTLSRPEAERGARWPIIAVSAIVALLIIALSALWLRSDSFSLPGFGDSGSKSEQGTTAPLQTAAQGMDDQQPVTLPASAEQPRATPSKPPAEDLEEVNNLPLVAGPPPAANAESVGQPEQTARPVSASLDDDQLELSISFKEDSWVEIYDAARRRLFFDLARAGTTRTVRGEPPLQVLLGNGSTARVRVNGEVWPIPAAARRGKTARFTVR